MKIICISDTHGYHEQLDLPAGDMIIHAGDISKRGLATEVRTFIDWFTGLPYRHKLFIGGNHDFMLENQPALFKELLNDQIIYLEDDWTEIEGIRIWGSPITPFFFDWAFNRHRGADIKRYWEPIPDDIDILVTHGPPLGYGDRIYSGDLVGCADLLEAVQRVRPAYHIFGHIHEAYGTFTDGETRYLNASVVNLSYQVVNPPIVFDFTP
ncbi:MAG: metallophosphatase domain-containing protein [Bacteroidota bacterium]